MLTLDHVSADFPPAFISDGNTDPLARLQSKSLAEKLQRLGVDTTTFFFPKDRQPGLGHEYQFSLDDPDGQRAMEESVQFQSRIASSR